MQESAVMREQVISANVEFYKVFASKYDSYEACVSERHFQQMLEADVSKMESLLPKRKISCLDCGGGSGNLTLKMLARGWDVTIVDVSSDMLEVSKTKINSCGFHAEFVNDSIEHYLTASDRDFDVITFSSVLHHIYSPLTVVDEIAARVIPGGFFYSNFDPVVPSFRFLTSCFYSLDTLFAKALHDRGDFLPGIGRRLRKFALAQDAVHSRAIAGPGDLAEYHARKGLDDVSLVQALERQGFVVDEVRYPVARTKFMSWLNSHLRLVLNFKILARRKDTSRVEMNQ
jgi:ubiquinone/menaquinone biosynthesis C-methylase UbiE